ncbi:hypothetical protein AVEN_62169-1 [Araneus ventricosus]|uniref:Uncharacterized protein n=1 Tax=Araneus ventricosus TaxID=182803 RepID=A0A4Y2WRU0_ARAVE|nr:hypothetical protein AVEN_274528-1 [Araneus ventricosus]GBO38586.1 hypothetical protein AVEN_51233-1 [Araneus ventricosus]GBO38587.1 hypothetical protein AVEN_140814-1 [Araneus ventricosus]GBO38593.1 hypothetical protein AVEN_62169-1 [Araneus ventricosus]
MVLKIGYFLKQRQRSKPDIYNCIQAVLCKCAVSTLHQTCFAIVVCKCVESTTLQTCFAGGLVDYALLLCRKFAANLPHQVCHDKLISKRITLAASVRAIWVVRRGSGAMEAPVSSDREEVVTR